MQEIIRFNFFKQISTFNTDKFPSPVINIFFWKLHVRRREAINRNKIKASEFDLNADFVSQIQLQFNAFTILSYCLETESA